MCGIVAAFSRAGTIDPAAVEAATRQLRHRGPDATRTWMPPPCRVALGHARLSVVDLATGDQPMASEDARLHAVVGGEFYDFERLRDELIGRHHRFRSRSDSEILLHLYEERGPQCLQDLRGEFAFVLHDAEDEVLFAARDRFGIKPLFYAVTGDVLLLASEVKALFAAGVPARWDRESVYQHLFCSVDQDRSLFDGVYQVPPGHYLLATSHRTQVVPYWDLDYPQEAATPRHWDVDESGERIRGAVEQSVRLRLRADVPVACYLSGGVDSTVVATLAAMHADRPLDAYTVAFDDAAYDESSAACATARHLGARFHPVKATRAQMAADFADAVVHGEMLCQNAHGVARYLLSKTLHAQGGKVALAGEGGDELFGGYVFARRSDRSPGARRPDTARDRLRRAQRRDADATDPAAGSAAAGMIGFAPSLLEGLSKNRVALRPLLTPGFAEAFGRRDPYRLFLSRLPLQRCLSGRARVHQSLYLWCKSVFPNYVLAAERLDMAHAVEVRLPLLDHELFEVAREIPADVLIGQPRDKHPLREAMRPLLTDAVYRRPKHPFTAPPLASKGDPLAELTCDMLRSSAFADVPFFDTSAVAALVDGLPGMDPRTRTGLDAVLLMMTSAAVLQQRYRLQ